MLEFWSKLLDTSDFPPRWHCGTWTSGHGWLHILSDLGTWGAYTAIPLVLAYFVLKRKDVVFPRVFWLFVFFILACGFVHLIEASIFWWPWYRLSGVVKLMTALVSWATVVALIFVIPRALTLPGLAQINKRLEEEIAQRTRAERWFRMVFEASPNAMMVVDQAGVIALANSESEHLFGYARDQLVGQPVERLVPASFRPNHARHRQSFFASPQSRPIGGGRELYGLRKDGSEFPVEIGLNPIEMDGRVVVLCAVVDISQQKDSELVLREINEELQDKNDELEQFVYTVSHDLKAPLVTTMGFVGALKEDLADGDAAGVQDAVQRIEGAARHMSELIEDLLQLSRIGRTLNTVGDVDVEEVIRSVVERYSAICQEKGAALEVQTDMPHVVADQMRLAQLFGNLIGNALKYGCDASDPRITIGWERGPEGVRFFVRDNGKGVPAEYHEKIFGLFQRLENRQEGTGVGLAIVARIAQAHGGSAWVESSEAAGATFWVSLPTA